MSRKKNTSMLAAGILIGAVLTGPTANAAEAYLKVLPSSQTFYLDGKQVALEAYAIEGHNYIQLAEVGKLLGAEVIYQASDNSVRITTETGASQTRTDGTVILPTDGSRYVPKAGDVIQCDDGTQYTITDVSQYDKSMFASGPIGELPSATCDWSSFPEVELPKPEARHFDLEAGDYLFIRNLYESRRMQYTIQNLAGNHPETSRNGKLEYGSKGTPAVRIKLTIDPGLTAHSFWPWRESALEDLFNSCPPGTYSMEAWDVFRNGVYMYTEYKLHAI